MDSLVINIDNKKHWKEVQCELLECFEWDSSYVNIKYMSDYNLAVSLTQSDSLSEQHKIHLWIKDGIIDMKGGNYDRDIYYCKDVDELLEMYNWHKLGLI